MDSETSTCVESHHKQQVVTTTVVQDIVSNHNSVEDEPNTESDATRFTIGDRERQQDTSSEQNCSEAADELEILESGNIDGVKQTSSADDEGEIMSDGEGAEASVAADEPDTTTAAVIVPTVNVVTPAAEMSTEDGKAEVVENLNDNELDTSQSSKTKKSALEHLRNMKFSKHDLFSDSSSRDRSLRFNREDRPSEQTSDFESGSRRKRAHEEDRDRRRRYRHGVSPSSQVSSTTDVSDQQQQKRQRSTMYFLMQNNDQHQQPAQQFHHHQLPPSLKGILQTSGHLKQKLESLLSLKDDQVFSLCAGDLESLLMYAFELAADQNRLLNGRKAQLKQLDQMIQKERDLIDQIVQEIPSHGRPNLTEILNGNSSNPTTNQPAIVASISMVSSGKSTMTMAPPVVDFSVPPPTFKDPALGPIVSQNTQFSQPPPAIPKLEATAPPPSDFSKPPPLVSTHQGQQPPAVVDIMPSQLLQPPPSVSIGTTPMSFATPPPPIIHTSTTAPPPNVSIPSSQLPVNTSIPPPNVCPTSSASVTVNTSSSVVPLANLTAPPPPIDFSLPPPIANPSNPSAELLSVNASASSPIKALKMSHSSSNISGQAEVTSSLQFNESKSSQFSHPPPTIIKNTSTNITAALDLSTPPPSLTSTDPQTASSSSTFKNLSQPPPLIQKQQHTTMTSTTMQQISQNIMATVAASVKQQQSIIDGRNTTRSLSEQRGPVPLMSIEPTTFVSAAKATNIPSLASLSRNSVTIKRQAKLKTPGSKAKKNQRRGGKKRKEKNSSSSCGSRGSCRRISDHRKRGAGQFSSDH